MDILKLKKRLANYPGAHDGEEWKLDKNLNHCTKKEKEAIAAIGATIEELELVGLTRGEVHHILFGYKYGSYK